MSFLKITSSQNFSLFVFIFCLKHNAHITGRESLDEALFSQAFPVHVHVLVRINFTLTPIILRHLYILVLEGYILFSSGYFCLTFFIFLNNLCNRGLIILAVVPNLSSLPPPILASYSIFPITRSPLYTFISA